MLDSSLFSNIHAQPQVKDFLQTSIAEGKTSHAYLFLGDGSAETFEMAHAFAQGLLCEKGGCGACNSCIKVARLAHPDLHVYKPLGVNEYLLDQIKELLQDTELQAVYGGKKVYVLEDADMLGQQSANALLKTLEEPPASCVFILIAPNKRSVLPTIASRCQLIPFRALSDDELVKSLVQNSGASEHIARVALSACNNSIREAKEFFQSSYKLELRRSVLELMSKLDSMDALDILNATKELLLDAKAPLAHLKEVQAALLDEQEDFLSKSAQKELQSQQKRELTQAQRSSIIEILNIIRSYLRDALLLMENSEAKIVNEDYASALLYLIKRVHRAQILAAFERIGKAEQHIKRNVTAQVSMEALFLDLKEGL